MYERFTDRARKVMQLANQEAQRMNHEYVGTEHMLCGIVKEGGGIAAMVLHNLKIEATEILRAVRSLVKDGPEMVTMGKLPQTPRAKRVIELAMEEARKLDHDYVGAEHVLLGLLQEKEGIAFQVLDNSGVKYETTRGAILDLLNGGKRDDNGRTAVKAAPSTCVVSNTCPEKLRHAVTLAALRLEQHGGALDREIAKELRAAADSSATWTIGIGVAN